MPPELAQSALDAAPDAMLIIDAGGTVLFANRQVSALFGYDHDAIIGQPIEALMPQRFRSRHVGHRMDYVAAAHVRPMGVGLDLYAQRQDGTEFPVEISLSPIQSGERRLVAAAIRDVTARKRAEHELIEARRVAEQAQELAVAARESADRANHGKSRFLATASHDLRQPLQALALLNRTLRSIVTDRRAGEALAQQEQTIAAMSRLLNALLDISKLESGAIKPEPTDFTVARLFEELRREFAGLAVEKGLELRVESCVESVHSDPSLVEEIMRNLVSNAIKYTRQGWVQLKCLHEPACVRIQVLDTGIGIPSDQLPYIFDEFYQVGVPTNSSREGYGLGLSIVQRIAALLNLNLEVRSEPGRGSAFSLTLPLVPRRPAAAVVGEPAPRVRANPMRRGSILLVEDDPTVRNAARLLLSVEDYAVTAVATLAEALEAVQGGTKVDLLVTDFHLHGGETGLKVIAALREVVGPGLKSILITGDTSSAVRNLTQDRRLRVMSKPVDADQMLGLIEAFLATDDDAAEK